MLSTNVSRASTPLTESTPPTTLDDYATPDILFDFKSRPHLERFKHWRPSYHLQAPRGWMNDPCAPGYNSATGLYHVSFQWNPHGNDWGNISWCSATSPDMLNWTVDPIPTHTPDQPYDCEGVFTGCMVNGQDGSLNYFYTSVSSLPIHHTLSHPKGCESLSLSSSYDNGRTWRKSSCNPILQSEPSRFDVTGWRDPYVARWPKMSALLGLDSDKTLFGVVSGGIRDVTPTTFLYAMDADNLTEWKLIGPVVNREFRKTRGRWSGDLGKNWEVTNFVCNLKDEINPTIERDFLIMGTEGCEPETPEAAEGSLRHFRPNRNQLWASVSANQESGRVALTNDYGGHLDHGCFYAANSFYDPNSQRQVVWGWITEEDLGDDLRQAQGWSGMLSLPRELRVQTLQHVVSACASDLRSISSIELEPDAHGSYTIRTLASQPCPAVTEALRHGNNVQQTNISGASLRSNASVGFASKDIQSLQWELDCSFRLSKSCRSVGVHIRHCENPPHSTSLLFNPSSETFEILRPAPPGSSSSHIINSNPESAPHTLFTMRDSETGTESLETLDIRAWRDNSVLEVFVNGRTAISTRLYTAGETCGMHFFADDCFDGNYENDTGSFSNTELLRASVWSGLGMS